MQKRKARINNYFTVDWFGLILQSLRSVQMTGAETYNTQSGGTASCPDVSKGGWEKEVGTAYRRYS